MKTKITIDEIIKKGSFRITEKSSHADGFVNQDEFKFEIEESYECSKTYLYMKCDVFGENKCKIENSAEVLFHIARREPFKMIIKPPEELSEKFEIFIELYTTDLYK